MKKLGFGFMRLPMIAKKNPDMEQIKSMVDEFMANGFNYFDTAYFYLDGKSEGYLKESLVDRYDRDKFVIADKLPVMFLTKKSEMEEIFNNQLERCGVEYIDYYLLHALNKVGFAKTKLFKIFEFAAKKKEEGKIKKLGFSFHDKAKVLDKILTEHPEVDFVQLQINYLDWEDGKVQSKLCYEVARKHGVDIIIMEPIKGGSLANVPTSVEQMFKKYDENSSVASWAVRFAASLDGVKMVLSGMSTQEQMDDNLSYMNDFKPLNQEEIQMCFRAADIIKSKNIVPCTACKYCIEVCPKNIAIADYFALYNQNINKGILDEKTYETLCETFGKASDCIECKKCEGICPQKIEIVKQLKNVKSKFE
ncbi:MAG: aldo/keto reductase [Clostridia bacterium]